MDHLVFAYGSNMHLGDLSRWCLAQGHPAARVLRAEAAIASGYRLAWNYYSPGRKGGAANVEEAPGEVLPGVLLQVDEAGFQAIDAKEAYPDHYDRRLVPVSRVDADPASRDVQAWIYVVQPAHRRPTFTAPTRHYRQLLVDGARAFELPAGHVETLASLETCD